MGEADQYESFHTRLYGGREQVSDISYICPGEEAAWPGPEKHAREVNDAIGTLAGFGEGLRPFKVSFEDLDMGIVCQARGKAFLVDEKPEVVLAVFQKVLCQERTQVSSGAGYQDFHVKDEIIRLRGLH